MAATPASSELSATHEGDALPGSNVVNALPWAFTAAHSPSEAHATAFSAVPPPPTAVAPDHESAVAAEAPGAAISTQARMSIAAAIVRAARMRRQRLRSSTLVMIARHLTRWCLEGGNPDDSPGLRHGS